MEHIPYSEKKKNFDKHVMMYLAKRIVDDPSDADAYNFGITDLIGNKLVDNDDSKWAFTDLDKFVIYLRQKIGADNLRDLLSGFSFLKEVDPLMCLNWDGASDLTKKRKALGELVTIVEDSNFLPSDISRDVGEHLEEDDVYSFQERCARSLTILSYLLYALKKKGVPNDIDFKFNVCPSVEVTFGHRAWPDHKWCNKVATDNGFVDQDGITKKGLKLLAKAASKMVEGKLLNTDISRVENQSKNWNRIASI